MSEAAVDMNSKVSSEAIEVSEIESDTLVEIGNIGAGLALRCFSEVFDDRFDLEMSIPELEATTRMAWSDRFKDCDDRYYLVDHKCSGPFEMHGFVSFKESSVEKLKESAEFSHDSKTDEADLPRMIVTKVGRMLLSSVISSFSSSIDQEIKVDSISLYLGKPADNIETIDLKSGPVLSLRFDLVNIDDDIDVKIELLFAHEDGELLLRYAHDYFHEVQMADEA